MSQVKTVRVMVLRNHKVCVYTERRKGAVWDYNFPGGGVDAGETPETAAHREVLEEVGFAICNLRPMSIATPNPRGEEAHYFQAEYDREDHSLLGSEGDAQPYEWLEIGEAIKRIEHGPKGDFNPTKIEALQTLMKKPAFLKW